MPKLPRFIRYVFVRAIYTPNQISDRSGTETVKGNFHRNRYFSILVFVGTLLQFKTSFEKKA